jgi:formylglycine-generating enzyme required for sulfatase activity
MNIKNFLVWMIFAELLFFFAGCSDSGTSPSPSVVDTTYFLPPKIKVELTNHDIEIEFVYVPPGTFQMGCDPNWLDTLLPLTDISPSTLAAPKFMATITRGYYIGKYNITVGQFGNFLSAKNTLQRRAYTNMKKNNKVRQFDQENGLMILVEKDIPVSTVTYSGAVAFCDWMTDISVMKFRLPTEAEWEYATKKHFFRAPTNGLGNWVCDYFNYYDKTAKIDPNVQAASPAFCEGSKGLHVLRRPISSIVDRTPGYDVEDNHTIYGFRITLNAEYVKKYLDNPREFQSVTITPK